MIRWRCGGSNPRPLECDPRLGTKDSSGIRQNAVHRTARTPVIFDRSAGYPPIGASVNGRKALRSNLCPPRSIHPHDHFDAVLGRGPRAGRRRAARARPPRARHPPGLAELSGKGPTAEDEGDPAVAIGVNDGELVAVPAPGLKAGGVLPGGEREPPAELVPEAQRVAVGLFPAPLERGRQVASPGHRQPGRRQVTRPPSSVSCSCFAGTPQPAIPVALRRWRSMSTARAGRPLATTSTAGRGPTSSSHRIPGRVTAAAARRRRSRRARRRTPRPSPGSRPPSG